MSSHQVLRRVGRTVTRSILFGSLSAIVAGAALTGRLSADDTTSYYNFNGSSSTDWMNGANWTSVVDGTTGTLPTTGSATDVAGGLTAQIDTPANPAPTINIEQLYVGQDGDSHGPATFPNPNPPPPTIQYPAIATGDGTVNQSAGTLNVGGANGWIKLGAVAGTTGTYHMTGTATVNLTNDFFSVGEHGTGSLSMTDNSALTTTAFTTGRWGDGSGTVTIGGSATLTSSGDTRVGDQGVGTLTQSGGTINATGASWVDIGRETGSHGTYNMTGGTLNLGVAGGGHNADLNVGNDGTGVMNQSGNSAVVQNDGWIFIARQANTGGDNNGSTLAPASGTYTLTDTSSITTPGRIYVGGSGNAVPTFGAPTGTLTVGTKAGDNPTVTAGDEIHVGDGGIGVLTQNSGTVQITSGSWLKIGRAGGTGTYNMNNGSLTIGDTIMIGGDGANGTGTFNLVNGSVTSAAVRLGQNGGGNNQGTFNQTGGSVTTGDVRVGWDGGNTGTYNIRRWHAERQRRLPCRRQRRQRHACHGHFQP